MGWWSFTLSFSNSKAALGSLTPQHTPDLFFVPAKSPAPDQTSVLLCSVVQKLQMSRSSESVCNSRNTGWRKWKGYVCRLGVKKQLVQKQKSIQLTEAKHKQYKITVLWFKLYNTVFQNKADEFWSTFPPHPTTKVTLRSREFLEKEREKITNLVWNFSKSEGFVRPLCAQALAGAAGGRVSWKLMVNRLTRLWQHQGRALERPRRDLGKGWSREQQRQRGCTNSPNGSPLVP